MKSEINPFYLNSIWNITSYHHLYYKLSHNKQYIIHDAQPIFHKSCSSITNETTQPSNRSLFARQNLNLFLVQKRCNFLPFDGAAIVYISLSLFPQLKKRRRTHIKKNPLQSSIFQFSGNTKVHRHNWITILRNNSPKSDGTSLFVEMRNLSDA